MNIIRARRGRKVVSLAAITLFTLAFTTVPATRSVSAEPAEQVIFSGVAVTNNGLFEVGFWIWCMPEANSPIYTGACKGSVRVTGQEPASAVVGFVVENPDGTYVARVFAIQPNNFVIAAAFHNVDPTPAHGPNNVVQFGILTPGGQFNGVAHDAVVNVTGPGD